MANLKDITQVPELEVLDGSEKVLLNANGAAKQVRVDSLKSKKELVYEWNFSADDEVFEIYENVNDDLTWLTKKQEGIDFEAVIECYAHSWSYSNDQGDFDHIFHTENVGIASSIEAPRHSRYTNIPFYLDDNITVEEALAGEIRGCEWYNEKTSDGGNTWHTFSLHPYAYYDIEKGIHLDYENESVVIVNKGGVISFSMDTDNPFKSIKIYKIIN